MKYRAILFDLDGTLFDSVPIILKAAGEVFADMGLPFDEAAYKRAIGIPLSVQGIEFAGERADEFIERYKAKYRALQEEHAQTFPGTAEMLSELRALGYTTAIVTSKSTWATQRALYLTGIDDMFDTIVTADDVIHCKPSPDPILKALETLRLKPEEALYVGDSMFDVDAAQRAGVDMVGVSWGARSKADLQLECADGVFDNWQEFLDWLRGSLCSAPPHAQK